MSAIKKRLTISGLSVLVFLFLLLNVLNAQTGVKIKAKLEINPRAMSIPQLSAASGGGFTINFQYSGTLDPNSNKNPNFDIQANYSQPCEGRYYERTAPLMTGAYQTIIGFTAVTNGTATYSYSANGQELKSGTFTVDQSPCTVLLMGGFYFSESFKFNSDSVVTTPGYWEDAMVHDEGMICQSNVQWGSHYLTTWTVVQGSEWGQFYDKNDNPVGTTYTGRANDMQYLFGFRLAPNIPDTVFCIIKAESNGIVRYKRIYPINYKIPVITLSVESATLVPLGDNDNKGPKNAKVIDFSKVKWTTATVSVKYSNGTPVADYPFTLNAYARDNSGGHDHTSNRPKGRFVVKTDTVSTFSDKTGADGTAKYTYLTSGFGGIDSLRVQGKTEKDTSTATILLKMGVFQELTEGAHYDLVGVTTTHKKNHYGTANTIQRLKALADSAYADSSWVLQYNDMSLIYGGPFDHKANWNTPHQNHREGKQVDMRPASTAGSDVSVKWLQKKLFDNHWGTVIEEDTANTNHHFHFNFK